jgi:hypothetical protein
MALRETAVTESASNRACGNRSRTWWVRACWAVALLAAVPVGWAYTAALSAPAGGTYHDDAIYLVTARSLAAGEGYRIASLPESPPQTKYPIVFPWLLALVWRVVPDFPANLAWLRLIPMLSAGAWLALAHVTLRRAGAPPTVALALTLLCACSPALVYFSTALLSETLFAALATAAVLVASSAPARQLSAGRCIVAGILVGLCILTRIAGVAVAAGLVAWLVVQGNRRGAVWFAAVASAAVAPWLAWATMQAHLATDAYYSAVNYSSWNVVASYDVWEKAQVLAINLLHLLAGPAVFWGVPLSGSVVVVCGLVVGPVMARGWWLTRTQPGTWCGLAVVTMNLLWVWPPFRLTLPVAPLLLWPAFVGLRSLLPVPLVLLALGLGLGLVSSRAAYEVGVRARTTGSVWFPPDLAEDWRRLSPMLTWIARETPEGAIVAGNLDPMYFLYTGRKAIRPYSPDSYALNYGSGAAAERPLGTVDDFKTRLLSARVDFCIWSPGPGFGESRHYRRLLDDLSGRYPGSLTVAAGEPAGDYVVYQVNRSVLERLTD